MNVRIDRLGNIMLGEISKILENEINDSDIEFVTLTSCKITNDLSFAKVYFTTLGDRDKTLQALNGASKYIRSLVAQNMIIRKMPVIIFEYDESIEYGQKIDDIIERINEDGGSN